MDIMSPSFRHINCPSWAFIYTQWQKSWQALVINKDIPQE